MGFTKVGEDYYFFNAGSGKMYKDTTLWVGNNSYGITGGMYRFWHRWKKWYRVRA